MCKAIKDKADELLVAQRKAQRLAQKTSRASKKAVCPLCREIIPMDAKRPGVRLRHINTRG
jgi:hypothetical protein